MPLYCFNPNCDQWGERTKLEPIGMILIFPSPYMPMSCPECGGLLIYHNWDEDLRQSDDGT